LLIATAMTEKLTLISGDREFKKYGVATLW